MSTTLQYMLTCLQTATYIIGLKLLIQQIIYHSFKWFKTFLRLSSMVLHSENNQNVGWTLNIGVSLFIRVSGTPEISDYTDGKSKPRWLEVHYDFLSFSRREIVFVRMPWREHPYSFPQGAFEPRPLLDCCWQAEIKAMVSWICSV